MKFRPESGNKTDKMNINIKICYILNNNDAENNKKQRFGIKSALKSLDKFV